jgi:DNA-binding Xre family transcriptional regulator
MSQTSALLVQLKSLLKAKGLTYRQLGQSLALSEASVKRLFSRGTLTVERLEAICAVLGISLHDLTRLAATAPNPKGMVFSLPQEEGLARDPKLFAYYYLLVGGLRPAGIVADFRFSEAESRRFVHALDKLRLVELLPGDRVKLTLSPDAEWLPHGPLRRLYEKPMAAEFLDSPFDGERERLHFRSARLSPATLRLFLRKMDRLVRELQELTDLESTRPADGGNLWCLVAIRPWAFSVLQSYRRK